MILGSIWVRYYTCNSTFESLIGPEFRPCTWPLVCNNYQSNFSPLMSFTKFPNLVPENGEHQSCSNSSKYKIKMSGIRFPTEFRPALNFDFSQENFCSTFSRSSEPLPQKPSHRSCNLENHYEMKMWALWYKGNVRPSLNTVRYLHRIPYKSEYRAYTKYFTPLGDIYWISL